MKNLNYLVFGFGALFAFTGGNIFGLDLSVLSPFMLIGVSGFGLWGTYSCCKTTCDSKKKDTRTPVE